ncbi:MAG TPA: ABC transporter permease [Bryobacteraceae bacterium]|nr:ABC transporter permease [Bryobacteraceae bacterium]
MRFYRALLHLYPTSFRNEYGDEMAAIFAQRRRDAANPLSGAILWIAVFFEILFNAFAVHWDILRQDLSYAFRTLARTPGFTATAIVVGALGVGATTATFTMVDHVLIRPLPFVDPDRLVKIAEGNRAAGYSWSDLSPANFRDFQQRNRTFTSMGAFQGSISVNLAGEGDPQRIDGSAVGAEVLPLLGVPPLLGRYFTADDDREGAPGTVILSFTLWQGLFGGAPAVLGRKLLLDDRPCTVIGVMPRDFNFPNRNARLWTPLQLGPQAFENRRSTYLYGIGRLKPGVAFETAEADLKTIASQLAREYPKELANMTSAATLLRDELTDQSKTMLKALLAASACVLLIAVTNLANLLLARALNRRRELAVRAAMGAGSERLIRQMLTESLLLAVAGGALGVAIAVSALPLLVRLIPVSIPIAQLPTVDLRVLGFALLVTCATGIGFGVIPALRARRGGDLTGLRDGARSGGGRREWLRSVLVAAEVTGSVVLLVSAGLLIRALWKVQAVDPGFRPDHVLTLRTSLPMPKYWTIENRQPFYSHVLSEARSLPGVTGAAYISFLPMVMRGGIWPVDIKSRPQDEANRQTVSIRYVTPGFFSAMGIPLRMGRDVAESDTRESSPVALVSDSFVKRYWPSEDPVGRQINVANFDRTVIGVVGEIRVRGLERNSEPQVYLSYKQAERVHPFYAPKDLVVRSAGDPAALAPALRRIIKEADPAQPVSDVRLMNEIVEGETATRTVQVRVLGAFALVAFLLAAIGIHGLLAFAVSSRSQEIGVRMALGARPGDILSMILREGLLLAAVGIVIGAGLAYGAGRAMQSLLAGVGPADFETFSAAVVLALVMTLAGSLLPAMRAVRIDPLNALRAD